MTDRTTRLALSGFLIAGLLVGCDSNPEGPKADANAPPPPKGVTDPSVKAPPNPAASKSKGNTAVSQ